jgi:predicted Fe-Mo cluster-binding NifX family protein
MRIAITSQGPNAASRVDSEFAGAPFFVVFDADTNVFTPYENKPDPLELTDPGVRAAQNLLELNVDGVITGALGGKAFAMLQAAGVVVYNGALGIVMDAIDQYKTGRLPCVIRPSLQGQLV